MPMVIRKLPASVSSSILSTSSLKSQVSVVKELVENAIDAVSDYDNSGKCSVRDYRQAEICLEIDQESAGLQYLSVSDNGVGIEKNDRGLLCLNCTTSKLRSTEDLSSGVLTCGFRGEALNLVARLSKTMRISTKTQADKMAESWTVSRSGLANSDNKSYPGTMGTTVTVTGLYESTPVRFNYLIRKKNKLLKDIYDLLFTYSLIHRHIRFQVKYVKSLEHKKIINKETKVFRNKIGLSKLLCEELNISKKDWLFEGTLNFCINDGSFGEREMKAYYVLPKMRAQDIQSIKQKTHVLSVNKRPLDVSLDFGKKIRNEVNEAYHENMLLSPLVWYISFEIPPNIVDVNIEPEKSDIIVRNEDQIILAFKKSLSEILKSSHGLLPDETDRVATKNGIIVDESESARVGTAASNAHILQQELMNMLEGSDDETLINDLQSHIANLSQRQDELLKTDSGNVELESGSEEEQIMNERLCNGQLKADLSRRDHNNETLNELGTGSSERNAEVLRFCDNRKHDSGSSAEPVVIELNSVNTEAKTNPKTTGKKSRSLSSTNSQLQDTTSPTKNTKQMSLSSYGTYHISEVRKPKITVKAKKLPKLIECSQDTCGISVRYRFQLTHDRIARSRLLKGDENWVKRKGIPSDSIVQAVTDLYRDANYPVPGSLPSLNESQIYELK